MYTSESVFVCVYKIYIINVYPNENQCVWVLFNVETTKRWHAEEYSKSFLKEKVLWQRVVSGESFVRGESKYKQNTDWFNSTKEVGNYLEESFDISKKKKKWHCVLLEEEEGKMMMLMMMMVVFGFVVLW